MQRASMLLADEQTNSLQQYSSDSYIYSINRSSALGIPQRRAIALVCFGWIVSHVCPVAYISNTFWFSAKLVYILQRYAFAQYAPNDHPCSLRYVGREINVMINKFSATGLGEGIVTNLDYGHKLSYSIQGIVASSIMLVVYPSLVDNATNGNRATIAKIVSNRVFVVSLLIIPMVITFIVLREPIVRLFFQRGEFVEDDAKIMSTAFGIYSLGVLPMSIKHVGDKLLYALKDTMSTMKNSIIATVLNIVLNVFFKMLWGYKGLALATSVALCFSACFIFFCG